MLKFTSVSGSVRATTDITHTDTIIRIDTMPDLIIGRITAPTIGTADTAIIAITTHIITGAKF
jgi:hypothetical protein